MMVRTTKRAARVLKKMTTVTRPSCRRILAKGPKELHRRIVWHEEVDGKGRARRSRAAPSEILSIELKVLRQTVFALHRSETEQICCSYGVVCTGTPAPPAPPAPNHFASALG